MDFLAFIHAPVIGINLFPFLQAIHRLDLRRLFAYVMNYGLQPFHVQAVGIDDAVQRFGIVSIYLCTIGPHAPVLV